MEFLANPQFYLSLLSVTFIQIALGADNIIVLTIVAGKLKTIEERTKAIRLGMFIAMALRIALLFVINWILVVATAKIFELHADWFDIAMTWKALVLIIGGFILILKAINELRHKVKGYDEKGVESKTSFTSVIMYMVAMNLLFSVDSILTVVGMTDMFPVMVGSVVISVLLMVAFVGPIARFISKNPDFEILGIFILMFIGFVLFMEGGHEAHIAFLGSEMPHFPQWVVVFFLVFIISVVVILDLAETKREEELIQLHHHGEDDITSAQKAVEANE